MIALLLDPPGNQGYAGDVVLDDAGLAQVTAALRVAWPRRTVQVDRSPYATDARRLQALPLEDADRVLVVRPAAALLPASVLRAALKEARQRHLAVARLAAVPADVCYIASAHAIGLLAALGGVPGCVTLPQVLDRLAGAGASMPEGGLEAGIVSGLEPSASRTPQTWRTPHLLALLALPSEARLDEAIRLEQQAFSDARTELHRLAGGRGARARGVRKDVLVVVPSMYQSGAQAAWAELSGYLAPAKVAFVVGQATALAGVLEEKGFAVNRVTDGLGAHSAPDAARLMAALDDTRPRVVHFDGAEGSTWAAAAFARGPRVVQHVRLNDVDRFKPAFVYADAVVGVSSHVCLEVQARVGSAVRVEHIPDGVCLQTRQPRTERVSADPARRHVFCLCVGRVEPAKGQLRVLDIFASLSRQVACRLAIVGPCGRDAAYCDEVRDRLEADGLEGHVTWEPFRYPMDDLYTQADIVLVGSRNEALGMVGLEALAAGALLVAQRSTGYEAIVDPSRQEGLLFDRDEPAADVAARIAEALRDAATYARHGRRKVESRFDARETAASLTRLWRDVAALR